MQTVEQRAQRYATKAHAEKGQRRKYTDEPYIVHPVAVVALVRSVNHNEEMLAAAWLHDAVENTASTLNDIRNHVGNSVAILVEMLTTSGVKGMAGPLMRRVLNQYIYENVSDAFAPAAIHLLAISRGHIFNDGNMRTALFFTLLFLRHNRIEIQSSDILTVEATLGS